MMTELRVVAAIVAVAITIVLTTSAINGHQPSREERAMRGVSESVRTHAVEQLPLTVQVLKHASTATDTAYQDLTLTDLALPEPFTSAHRTIHGPAVVFTLNTTRPVIMYPPPRSDLGHWMRLKDEPQTPMRSTFDVTCTIEMLAAGVGTPPSRTSCVMVNTVDGHTVPAPVTPPAALDRCSFEC